MPGQSQLVIVHQVLPNTGVMTNSAFMDLTMMSFGVIERTKRKWEELLEGVGRDKVSIEGLESGYLSLDEPIKARLRAREGYEKYVIVQPRIMVRFGPVQTLFPLFKTSPLFFDLRLPYFLMN